MLHASHGKYFFDERSITAEAILKDFFIISHVTTVLGERFWSSSIRRWSMPLDPSLLRILWPQICICPDKKHHVIAYRRYVLAIPIWCIRWAVKTWQSIRDARYSGLSWPIFTITLCPAKKRPKFFL